MAPRPRRSLTLARSLALPPYAAPRLAPGPLVRRVRPPPGGAADCFCFHGNRPMTWFSRAAPRAEAREGGAMFLLIDELEVNVLQLWACL